MSKEKELKEVNKALDSMYQLKVLTVSQHNDIEQLRRQYENEYIGMMEKHKQEAIELSLRYMRSELDVLKKSQIITK